MAAVVNTCGWYNQQANTVYHEMAEQYGTAIIPTMVRKLKDKPTANSSVGNIYIDYCYIEKWAFLLNG